MAKTLKSWPRETVTLVGCKAEALLGFGTSVTLDGVEAIISAPTMEGLEKVYDELLRLDDEDDMKPFDPSLCGPVAWVSRTAIQLELDL
jgi:hypothetical protein